MLPNRRSIPLALTSLLGHRKRFRVYQDLLAFRSKTKKHVYVLASHSHFFIEDVYNDACHTAPNSILPGWIVRTAGAVRYRLPSNLSGAKQARTDLYGYLLATVQPGGEIDFKFKEIKPGDIPSQVTDRYGSKQVQACFEDNKAPYAPSGPDCTASNSAAPTNKALEKPVSERQNQ